MIRVESMGTERRLFRFTGRHLASTISFYKRTDRIFPWFYRKKLYETPKGQYRIVYWNGNVSFLENYATILNEHTRLARKAGLYRVVDLD